MADSLALCEELRLCLQRVYMSVLTGYYWTDFEYPDIWAVLATLRLLLLTSVLAPIRSNIISFHASGSRLFVIL